MNKIIFKILRLSGLPFLFRMIYQKSQVSILLFHELSVDNAKIIFNFLINNYNIIDLSVYIKAMEEGDFSKIPKNAMILTFDDGHMSNYKLLPIIKSMKIPITIFLCSGIINSNRKFWFRHIDSSAEVTFLKKLSNNERLKRMEKCNFDQEKEFSEPQSLSKKQILEMKKFINLQSHTVFHPCLPKCCSKEAKFEIYKSKEKLECEYGMNINTISYPNGDYSEREILLAKNSGYKCGITVDFGFNSSNTDIFRLKRFSGPSTRNIDEIIVKSSGVWSFLKSRNGRKQNYGYTENFNN